MNRSRISRAFFLDFRISSLFTHVVLAESNQEKASEYYELR